MLPQSRAGVCQTSPMAQASIPTGLNAIPDATPLDHTSILKTVETLGGLDPLTARDAVAVDVGTALSLTVARTDDPLDGVIVPVSGVITPAAGAPSHLEQVLDDLLARHLREGSPGSDTE